MPFYNLVLNSNNVTGSYNNELIYSFCSGSFHIPSKSKIAVSQITIPYSWFNISTFYNNNTFSYRWFYGNGLYQTYSVTFPDGFYSISDLQNYLEQYMISQNQYFTNTVTQENLYYIYFQTNTTYYSIQLICSPIPTSLPTGYSAPTNGFNYNNSTAFGYPNYGYGFTAQIVISSTTKFYKIIGFSAGTYPSTTTTSSYNILGTLIPNITPVNSLVILCDLVDNNVSSVSNILDTVAITSTFGSNINYTPTFQKWISLNAGNYVNFTMGIVDQDLNSIKILDSYMLISLIVETPDEKLISDVKV